MLEITKVAVEYGELRSSGYPNFSNTRHQVSYEAKVGADDDFEDLRGRLHAKAVSDVKAMFGDKPERNEAAAKVVQDARGLMCLLNNNPVIFSETIQAQMEALRKSVDELDQVPF